MSARMVQHLFHEESARPGKCWWFLSGMASVLEKSLPLIHSASHPEQAKGEN